MAAIPGRRCTGVFRVTRRPLRMTTLLSLATRSGSSDAVDIPLTVTETRFVLGRLPLGSSIQSTRNASTDRGAGPNRDRIGVQAPAESVVIFLLVPSGGDLVRGRLHVLREGGASSRTISVDVCQRGPRRRPSMDEALPTTRLLRVGSRGRLRQLDQRFFPDVSAWPQASRLPATDPVPRPSGCAGISTATVVPFGRPR